MLTNRRAWAALKKTLWWCLTSFFHLWNLNPFSVIRRRHARLYYMKTDDSIIAKPRWTDILLNILMSDSGRKARLLKWVQRMTDGANIDNFTDSWHDGIAVCSLMEAVSPGSCPQLQQLKAEYSKSNCQLGLKAAQKYLFLKKIFITPEIMATANPETEKYVLHLVQLIKWRHQRCSSAPTTTLVKRSLSPREQTRRNVYEARGRGLSTAIIGRRATFTVFTENSDSLDLNIEIRGPNNEMNCEKITKISPEGISACRIKRDDARTSVDKNSSFHYLKDSHGNTVVRQRSVEEVNRNIIPLDYKFIGEKSFIVAYVPQSMGNYIIDIFSNGESIAGSPFEVTVTKWSSSWNKVTKKKLMMLDYVEDKCNNGVMFKENDSERSDQTERPRMLRQYTVTKRRVIKRMTTKNGQEIVITDQNASPATSRRSSADVTDLCEHSNWSGKQSSKSRSKNDLSAVNHLAARPFSPDNMSLCSFSRRSSGGMSDSNTSSSTDRHGDNDYCDSNLTPVDQAGTNKQGDHNKQTEQAESLNFKSDRKPHTLVKSHSLESNFKDKNSLRRMLSEEMFPKESVKSDDSNTVGNPQCSTLKIPDFGQHAESELNVRKNQDNKHKRRQHRLFSFSEIAEENKENITGTAQIKAKLSHQNEGNFKLSSSEIIKTAGTLVVLRDNKEVVNERRPPRALDFTNLIKKRLSLGDDDFKTKSDKSTQVTSEEIKTETNWDRRLVRRRRRIPCSSEEDKAMKIKEYRLKHALKNTKYPVNAILYSQLEGHDISKHPHYRVHDWLQNHSQRRHVRSTKQSTTDSGISEEGTTISRKTENDTELSAIKSGHEKQHEADIVDRRLQKKQNSVDSENQGSVETSKNETCTSSLGRMTSASDSEILCAPSILKHKRKLFARTKESRQYSRIEDCEVANGIQINANKPRAVHSCLERKPRSNRIKAHSIPDNLTETSEEYTERQNQKNLSYGSDSAAVKADSTVNTKRELHSYYSRDSKNNVTSPLNNTDNMKKTESNPSIKIVTEIPEKDISENEKMTSLSISEVPYEVFGVENQKRSDLLNEIKTFENLASLEKSAYIDKETKDRTALVGENRKSNTALQDIKETKEENIILDLEHKTGKDKYFPKRKESEYRASVFRFGRDFSLDTDSSFADDLLDSVHGCATEDDYWGSSEVTESCIATGTGIKYGYVGIQNNFQVWVDDPDVGNLMVGVRGPRPHCVTETSTTYTGDNLYEITYAVTLPGLYLVFVKWNNTPINNSPFIVKVSYVDDACVDDD